MANKHFANDKSPAVCSKCGTVSNGSAGCSHASCGGFFVAPKHLVRLLQPQGRNSIKAALMRNHDDKAAVWMVETWHNTVSALGVKPCA